LRNPSAKASSSEQNHDWAAQASIAAEMAGIELVAYGPQRPLSLDWASAYRGFVDAESWTRVRFSFGQLTTAADKSRSLRLHRRSRAVLQESLPQSRGSRRAFRFSARNGPFAVRFELDRPSLANEALIERVASLRDRQIRSAGACRRVGPWSSQRTARFPI